ncbi:MAG: transposase [Pseudonocardiaceae bacterium]
MRVLPRRSTGEKETGVDHQNGINAAIDRSLSNGRQEGLNDKVRLIIRRAYGFHSAQAALATVMLACGPVKLEFPYHTPPPTYRAVEPYCKHYLRGFTRIRIDGNPACSSGACFQRHASVLSR